MKSIFENKTGKSNDTKHLKETKTLDITHLIADFLIFLLPVVPKEKNTIQEIITPNTAGSNVSAHGVVM